jgi:hypothetical protein
MYSIYHYVAKWQIPKHTLFHRQNQGHCEYSLGLQECCQIVLANVFILALTLMTFGAIYVKIYFRSKAR